MMFAIPVWAPIYPVYYRHPYDGIVKVSKGNLRLNGPLISRRPLNRQMGMLIEDVEHACRSNMKPESYHIRPGKHGYEYQSVQALKSNSQLTSTPPAESSSSLEQNKISQKNKSISKEGESDQLKTQQSELSPIIQEDRPKVVCTAKGLSDEGRIAVTLKNLNESGLNLTSLEYAILYRTMASNDGRRLALSPLILSKVSFLSNDQLIEIIKKTPEDMMLEAFFTLCTFMNEEMTPQQAGKLCRLTSGILCSSTPEEHAATHCKGIQPC